MRVAPGAFTPTAPRARQQRGHVWDRGHPTARWGGGGGTGAPRLAKAEMQKGGSWARAAPEARCHTAPETAQLSPEPPTAHERTTLQGALYAIYSDDSWLWGPVGRRGVVHECSAGVLGGDRAETPLAGGRRGATQTLAARAQPRRLPDPNPRCPLRLPFVNDEGATAGGVHAQAHAARHWPASASVLPPPLGACPPSFLRQVRTDSRLPPWRHPQWQHARTSIHVIAIFVYVATAH